MSDLKSKLDTLTVALEKHEAGKPLPISIQDIHFIIGACGKLLSGLTKLEARYKSDMNTTSLEVDRFRLKWKEARKVSTRLDIQIMALRQVVNQAKTLSWWRKSKNLKVVLESLKAAEKKAAGNGPGIL